MGFVEDHGVVVGEDLPERVAPQGEIREEQMVVHDDDPRGLGLAPDLRQEAAFVVLALGPRAGVAARVDLAPERDLVGKIFSFASVAGFGRSGPRAHRVVDARLLDRRQERLVIELAEAADAEVVVAALHHRCGNGDAELPRDERKVFLEDLILERLRACRNDDPPVREGRGDEIGESLADARARLDEKQSPLAQRFVDREGHLLLTFAAFVGRERTRKTPSRSKDRDDSSFPRVVASFGHQISVPQRNDRQAPHRSEILAPQRDDRQARHRPEISAQRCAAVHGPARRTATLLS